jgi:hypothetical protein
MIQVYLKTEEFCEPGENIYYLLTGSGAFVAQKNELYSSLTQARMIPGLIQQKPYLSLSLPKMPGELFGRMYGFFEAAYQRWEGEAVVFIFYSPQSQEYRLDVPPQTLFRHRTLKGGWRTERKVAYSYLERPAGFIKLGDAHSHGDLPAFFSCADDEDDVEDGLKITMGRLDEEEPDLKVSFMVNGTRFNLNPENLIEDFSQPIRPSQEWLERITCSAVKPQVTGGRVS